MKPTGIPKEKILERLQYENPWWIDGKISDEFSKLTKRLYYQLFYPHVANTNIKRALVLMGPRRVGKTVMMHHAIDDLLEAEVNPQQICFISIDNPIFLNMGLEELFSLAREASGNSNPKGYFVFFDEIQYLKDWERHLKVMVDSYPSTKFIVSGSAAAALRLKSTESGAGRFTDFMLPPLTFSEYIHLKKLSHLFQNTKIRWRNKFLPFFTTSNIKEVNKHFLNYINFGGYPEVIFSETIQSNLQRYIKNDIIDKVLLRDLPSLYGIKDVQELNKFFTFIAYNTGNEFSLDTISRESGLEKGLIKKYLEYLEAAFLIKVVNKIDDNAKSFKRATFYKIYLTNPSLRSALFSPIAWTDDSMGNMVETTVYAQWLQRDGFLPKYARWKKGRKEGEVDMVVVDSTTLKPAWALEIKWSNRYFDKPQELKSLIHFCNINNINYPITTTMDKEGEKVIDELNITFIPSALYTYAIGVNNIRLKMSSDTVRNVPAG